MRSGFTQFTTAFPSRVIENGQPPFADFDLKRSNRCGVERRHIASPSDSIHSLSLASLRSLFALLGNRHGPVTAVVLSSEGTFGDPTDALEQTARDIADDMDIPVAAHVNYACSGFSAAVTRALELRAAHKHIAVVCTDIATRCIDYKDFATCILFGDGSAATSIAEDGPHQIERAFVETVDNPTNAMGLKRGRFFDVNGQETDRGVFRMDSNATYEAAVRTLTSLARDEAKKFPDDLITIVPHQPSERVLTQLRVQLSDEKNIQEIVSAMKNTGNLTSASVPAAIAQVIDNIPSGRRVLSPTVGAGPALAEGKMSRGLVHFIRG